MHKKLRALAITFITVVCLSLGGIVTNNNIPGFGDTTASAKTVLWKYGKAWVWTSKVESLGKKSIHKTHSKVKVRTYRVYISKGDLKAKHASGLTLIGGLSAGKAGAIVAGLVGDNFISPKHGYQYDIQLVNSKVTYSWIITSGISFFREMNIYATSFAIHCYIRYADFCKRNNLANQDYWYRLSPCWFVS